MEDTKQHESGDKKLADNEVAAKTPEETLVEEQMAELRDMFQREYDTNPDLYDERDLNRLMDTSDNNWHARRWIKYARNLDNAFHMLKDTMRWRKSIDLNSLTYEHFPREFYECGCLFEYGTDRKNRRVIYVKCRMFKPLSELNNLYDKFFAFVIDQCDKKSGSNGVVLVYDVTDAGLSNVDMSNIKFMTSLRDRFPLSSRRILIAGLPWVLAPVLKLVMSLIPAREAAAFRVLNLDELSEHIEPEQIPLAIGGTCKTKYTVIPAKARSIIEFEELSAGTASKLKKHTEQKTDPSDYEIVDTMQVA